MVKFLYEYPQLPMSSKTAELFFIIYMLEEDSENYRDLCSNVESLSGYKMLSKRCEATGTQVENKVLLFLALTQCEKPSDVACYHVTLVEMAKHNSPVTFDQMVSKFPMGFPNRESLDAAWDELKRELS